MYFKLAVVVVADITHLRLFRKTNEKQSDIDIHFAAQTESLATSANSVQFFYAMQCTMLSFGSLVFVSILIIADKEKT